MNALLCLDGPEAGLMVADDAAYPDGYRLWPERWIGWTVFAPADPDPSFFTGPLHYPDALEWVGQE